MIQFEFNNVIAEGSPNVDQATGITTQICSVVTKMTGLVIGDVLLTNTVVFEVGNSLTVINAWLNIRDIQAPQWVSDNYSELI